MLEAQIGVGVLLKRGEEGRLQGGVEEGVEGRGGTDGDEAAFTQGRGRGAGVGHRIGILRRIAAIEGTGRCRSGGHCSGMLVRQERGLVVAEGDCRCRCSAETDATVYSTSTQSFVVRTFVSLCVRSAGGI